MRSARARSWQWLHGWSQAGRMVQNRCGIAAHATHDFWGMRVWDSVSHGLNPRSARALRLVQLGTSEFLFIN